MTSLITKNFSLHATTIPEQTEGMHVHRLCNLVYVDCGLSCDTFNIIHITNGVQLKEAELAEALEHYRQKNFSYCIWISDENLTEHTFALLRLAGVTHQHSERGMVLELASYRPAVNELHHSIREIKETQEFKDYASVIAANWNPPDQHVVSYFSSGGQHLLNKSNNITSLAFYENRRPISVLEMFPSDHETTGIYGLATLENVRGRGIGSAMMTYALNRAKWMGYKYVVLQASEDGFRIYEKLGFDVVTTYHEYA